MRRPLRGDWTHRVAAVRRAHIRSSLDSDAVSLGPILLPLDADVHPCRRFGSCSRTATFLVGSAGGIAFVRVGRPAPGFTDFRLVEIVGPSDGRIVDHHVWETSNAGLEVSTVPAVLSIGRERRRRDSRRTSASGDECCHRDALVTA